MTTRCFLIRALRVTIRAIDWITAIDIKLVCDIIAVVFLWGMLACVLHAFPEWPWWLAVMALPGGIGAVIGTILGCCWIGERYAALRRWTEQQHEVCRRAKGEDQS